MESPATSQHEELGRRIRSLTSILHEFNVQKRPTPHKETSIFLRHFTTFLTYGDTQMVAVAGSISPEQRVRAVVAAQNPDSTSPVRNIRLTVVDKDYVRATDQDSDLMRHIKEVLGVLSTFDPLADDPTAQKTAFEIFFLSRSLLKFEACFKEDREFCGGKRFYEVIREWNPDPNLQELPLSWVNGSEGMLGFTEPVGIPSRRIEGQLQFEFSDRTKRAWSRILATMLTAVDKCIEAVKEARNLENLTAEESKEGEALDILNKVVRYLYCFISWKADIVKSLLTQTNMVSSITATFMLMDIDETDDNIRYTYRGLQETKGWQIFRYLQMVTAWHAAVNDFCSDQLFPELLKNLKVGLVEVPCPLTSVLSLEEICDEFFLRFPLMEKQHEAVLKEIKCRHSTTFSGCVHAEAILVGLLNYARTGFGQTSDTLGVGLEDWAMEHVVQPVAEVADPPIAVSKKCCWCCNWLGNNTGTDFVLPGTHGIMLPWDPPKIGVSLSVLGRLEQELWQALHDVVSSAVGPWYSRQSSLMGSQPMRPPAVAEIKLSVASKMMQQFGRTGSQV